MNESVIKNEYYNPNELSALVVDAIIRHVGDYANLHGQGWADVENALLGVFSDIVIVEDDFYEETTKIITIAKGE